MYGSITYYDASSIPNSISHSERRLRNILLNGRQKIITNNAGHSRSTLSTMITGTWKPTPPAYMDVIEPHWNKIRTFAIDSSGQFKPAPATRFPTDKESQFFKEAREVYEITKEMTDEQRSIAFFWDCDPFMMNVKGYVMFVTRKIAPGGHWMNRPLFDRHPCYPVIFVFHSLLRDYATKRTYRRSQKAAQFHKRTN